MKIIIIGGGIAGLSTYLYMKKYLSPNGEHELKIFESQASRIASEQTHHLNLDDLSFSTALVGGGLAVAPNGMRVLRDLSLDLHGAVTSQGFPCENNTFKAARGFTIGQVRAWDAREPPEYTVSSSRYGLWKCLADKVGDDAVQFKKVVEVAVDDGGKPLVRFADGSSEEADLVLGADGVRSTVKKAILQDDDGKYAPTYNGLSGVGGFIDQAPPQECLRDKSLCFTFGPNGFFGYAPASSTRTLWWSTCETSKIPDRKAIDPGEIYAQLKERHRFWKDPVLQDIISKAGMIDSIYPTWETPQLPTWSRGRVVLVGDAAHAMSPTSGQGASQAFEDAQTLTLLLARFLGQDGVTDEEAIKQSTKAYYDIRSPRVTRIRDRVKKYDSNKLPNQSIVAEYGMYFFLWLMNRFPVIGRLMVGDAIKDLYHWDARREIEDWVKKQAG